MNPDDYIEGTFDERNPINQEEIEPEQFTIDLSYYEELKELEGIKDLFIKWYKLNSFPLEKTSDEKVKLAELENQLIKKVGL